MIPIYLISDCIDKFEMCRNPKCHHAVKKNPETSRYYITMGHAGFNTSANNAMGYGTQEMAYRIIQKYLVPKQEIRVADSRSVLRVNVEVVK
jgi:hypothetical protein